MSRNLLDTDIMIDILRGYEPALKWLGTLEDAPGLPGFVVMELMLGCRNKQEMNSLQSRLSSFSIHWPTQADFDRALSAFSVVRLSHGLGILDVLIGECAIGLDASLCTFNVKHFEALADLTTKQPYLRKNT